MINAKKNKLLQFQKKTLPLSPSKPKAQMAELVDALVSNTSVSNDMPVRSRLWVR